MRRGLQIPFVQYGFCRLCNCGTNNLKYLCTHPRESNNDIEPNKGMTHAEAYRQLENLDLEAATKILFTPPPEQKKFGIDFHLVQLFFACLPSLAVYLVAQYARSDMKKMDEELLRKKKQAEDKEKAKEAEKFVVFERTDSELVKVKVRLEALEETIKEIADETENCSKHSIKRDWWWTGKFSCFTLLSRGTIFYPRGQPHSWGHINGSLIAS